MKRNLLLLALLCAATAASAEQVYKWTDAAGVVHYSDAPPPRETQNVTTVRVTGGDRPHAVPMEATPESQPKPDAGGAQPPAQGTNTASADQKKQNCDIARANLDLLNTTHPVAVKGADGKQQTLDDKGRQAQIAEANAQVTYFCR
jgi:hypothetical protein